ncbi:Gfo/Idh/MocA family oxidoreductase [Bacillus sp. FJAT-49711]|uniref:Gfo/Idh/MocA family protein n=1 Tax=Bacillus sp. FJAT-49711 TaxID=2833585 RepID=UPI001BC9B00A|nr:Gfo/Idh/MocA family oxidoreductase [Bacillus sp. FJAT-49711]MBS4220791.1 Gfo/Idh/MocA family oxidoreductase [Bacillus sp. FJAT-49711]
MKSVKVGIIGCGNISSIYCQAGQKFDVLDIIAVADLDFERAKARAEEYKIPNAYTVEELLADPEIEIVINLTIPKAHAEVCIAALEAGKHVYVEKPLAVSREDGERILKIAKEKGLLVGGAPDTFLGGGIQTCRKLIDDGAIGEVVGATGFMMSPGHESWHPDPEFYYQVGGGPMFDMGPYYITAFINLLGPIRRVTGSTRISFPERTITSKPKHGQKIQVEVPTHITGILDFENGAIATLITSFDVAGSKLPNLEVYGSKGTILVPDPNTFGGPVFLRKHGSQEWEEIPLTHGYIDNSRGVGVADMAYALRSGRAHRANGDLAFHVLDVMHGIHDASTSGSHYELNSTCEQPKPLPAGLKEYTLDM